MTTPCFSFFIFFAFLVLFFFGARAEESFVVGTYLPILNLSHVKSSSEKTLKRKEESAKDGKSKETTGKLVFC
jgi:hypothetical protein